MNRWLSHDRYRPLAIAPDGFVDPFGITRQPMTIEPDESRARSRSSASCWRSCCRSSPAAGSTSGSTRRGSCRRRRIDDFLAWVATLRALPELDGREMLMWGDMVSGRPDLVARLPDGRDGVRVGLRRLVSLRRALRRAGRGGRAVLGGAGDLELAEHPRVASRTPARPAGAPRRPRWPTGRRAILNTDWGDLGHLQQWVVSEPGLAYGAAVSWCLRANEDLDLGAALSTHVFGDPTGGLAEAVLALGDAHRLVTPQFPNMSTLVMNLYYPQLPVGRGLTAGLTAAELDAVEGCLEAARRPPMRARPDRDDAVAAGRRGPVQHRPRRLADPRRAGSPRAATGPSARCRRRSGAASAPSSTRSSSATGRSGSVATGRGVSTTASPGCRTCRRPT